MHIRDEMYPISCGFGTQKIRWLADTAIHRYDDHNGFATGNVHEIRMESGAILNLQRTIADDLTDDVHVYVQLMGKRPLNFSTLVV